MLYYIYNTTARLTFIPVYMTIPYPLPPRVVHTRRHEEEGDKRQSSCCIIHVVEHTTRSDQETMYIWLFHTHFLPGLYIHCFLVLSDRMLYYIYNTTTRLTFIPLLLMVMGMYNHGRKWVWNSHIYTVSCSYLIVCSTTCMTRSDQETVYIWLFHTHFLPGLYIPFTMRRRGIDVSLAVVLYM
jgi:hypothetical protein